MLTILITAGPTREALDPARYFSNRSSGRMGYALAEAARDAGHRVMLISGPVCLKPPAGVETIPVISAREMADAVFARMGEADAAVMCAAVADYRPAEVFEEKIKKTADTLTVTLVKNPDILGSLRQRGFPGVLVGFAAETRDVEAYAREKLRKKRCDLIVANDVSQEGIGFESADNEVALLFADGTARHPDRGSKTEIAREIIREVERLHAARPGPGRGSPT